MAPAGKHAPRGSRAICSRFFKVSSHVPRLHWVAMRRLVLACLCLVAADPAQSALAADPTPLEQQFSLASKPAVKILVRENGWYRVARKQLVAAGLPTSAEARMLQLFADGKQIPIRVRGASRGRLTANGAIEFYGRARNTLSTDTRTYWLVVGVAAGERIPTSRSGRAAGRVALSYPATVRRKERSIYITAIKNGESENFFGNLVRTEPTRQPVIVRDLDPRSRTTTLTVALHGLSTRPHQVKLALNGDDLGVLTFTGQVRAVGNFPVAVSRLKDGENTLTLQAAGGDVDVSLIDEVRLAYTRLYRAENDVLNFTVDPGKRARVSGFGARSLRLIDVSDPDHPRYLTSRVTKSGSGFATTIGSANGSRRIFALTVGKGKSPAAVVADRPSSWNRADRSADMVIVAQQSFLPALQRLKAFREGQGLSVSLVDVDDLYDEFAFGTHSPEAIKSFLAWTRDKWRKAPRYVLLVGDATADPRNFLGKGGVDLLPTKLIDTVYMQTASDDWFVDFNLDGLPELAIGRLPLRTAADATSAVDKIIRYEQTPANAAKGGALFVADKNEGWNFEADTRSVSSALPNSMSVQLTYRSQGPTDGALRNQLLSALNQGPSVVNYFGHGAIDMWTAAGLLTAADASNLRNERLSLYVMLTCLNGYFIDPNFNGLGEALIRADAGAIAVWSSSALVVASQQPVINREVYRLLFGPGSLTIAEAVAQAKRAIDDQDIRRSSIFFGDPTTRLR